MIPIVFQVILRSFGTVLPRQCQYLWNIFCLLKTSTCYVSYQSENNYCIQGKFWPRFIFDLFALWFEGEFKTGSIELFINNYVTKWRVGEFKTGQISFRSLWGKNKTGRIESCIQQLKFTVCNFDLFIGNFDHNVAFLCRFWRRI